VTESGALWVDANRPFTDPHYSLTEISVDIENILLRTSRTGECVWGGLVGAGVGEKFDPRNPSHKMLMSVLVG